MPMTSIRASANDPNSPLVIVGPVCLVNPIEGSGPTRRSARLPMASAPSQSRVNEGCLRARARLVEDYITIHSAIDSTMSAFAIGPGQREVQRRWGFGDPGRDGIRGRTLGVEANVQPAGFETHF